MHATCAIDLVRENGKQAQERAERAGLHLAALRAYCRRACDLRGLFGGCARV